MNDKTDATADLFRTPATLDELCIYISGGGTLREWCAERQATYSVVAAWIAIEEDSRTRYAEAEGFRDSFIKDTAIRNMRDFADLDISKAYDADGQLLSIDQMPADVRRAISSFEVVENYSSENDEGEKTTRTTSKVRFIDPVKAVDLLAKWQSMFIEKKVLEHGGKLTLEQLLDEGD